MPVYEYRCDACSHQFELRQKFSDVPSDSCPKCGGAVHKMVSTAAFSLKGGGWYDDGYGAKPDTTKPETTAAAVAGTADKTATAETKVAPATPAPGTSHPTTKSAVAETPAVATKKVTAE